MKTRYFRNLNFALVTFTQLLLLSLIARTVGMSIWTAKLNVKYSGTVGCSIPLTTTFCMLGKGPAIKYVY
jgi:non-ribosomal peptide synthetase component F